MQCKKNHTLIKYFGFVFQIEYQKNFETRQIYLRSKTALDSNAIIGS